MDELEGVDELDDFRDVDIGVLLAEPDADSEVLARWSERLDHYVQSQGLLDALRLRPSTDAPWPRRDNPMLGYLVERCAEIIDQDGLTDGIAWLANHAWFEASIAERSRLARILVDDC